MTTRTDALGAIIDADRDTLTAQHRLWDAVQEARRQGASWTEVGQALGVTRSAAQQRFGKPAPGRLA